VDAICTDLAAEHDALDSIVGSLAAADWQLPTPAEGWSIVDGISHLMYFDRSARLAATDADAFAQHVKVLMASKADAPESDPSVIIGRAMQPHELLGEWRAGRSALVEVLQHLDPKVRVPWYGPAMSARSFATARLMETWAHGQDIVDALGLTPIASSRLKHVAHIGIGARPFSYLTRGLTVPDVPVRVELDAPSGDTWTWGESNTDVVKGDAIDFCLAVTQRRHIDDTSLHITGDAAREWMLIAQSFAGGPGIGRTAGQFS
jgi:uncharacterized protein (TIGR03084 family)